MGKTLGKILITAGVLGIITSFSNCGRYIIKTREAEDYISKRTSLINEQIHAIKETPIHALYNDPNIPRNLDELIEYYGKLIEKRDKINNSQEIIDARKTKDTRSPFHIIASVFGLGFSLGVSMIGLSHYKKHSKI